MKFEILMSTYNGEKYLREQLDSILAQTNVDVHITIRDDGSSDGTANILDEYQEKYLNKITVYSKGNVRKGYAKSFIELISLAIPDADYYAFADQDDVWLPEKCCMAVKKLEKCSNPVKLYVCAIKNCDAELNLLSVNHFNKSRISLKSDFARHRFPGCAMVFSPALKKLVINVANGYNAVPSHDFIVSSTAALYGSVIIDDKSYILHRRTNLSLTSKNKWGLSRIRAEYNVVIKNKGENYLLAKMLFKHLKNNNIQVASHENIMFLKSVLRYKANFKNTIKLAFYPDFSCGINICDLETKFKILIRYY